jgi:hypothetical protein
VSIACALPASADPILPITLKAVDSGAFFSDGFSLAGEGYLTGWEFYFEFRSFFVFDLTGVTEPIGRAELRLADPAYCCGSGAGTADKPVQLFDVSTSVTDVRAASGGPFRVDIFDDLGTGPRYSSVMEIWPPTPPCGGPGCGKIYTMPFNDDGIAFLNARLGQTIVLGGAIQTPPLTGDPFFRFPYEYLLFNGAPFPTSDVGDVRELVLTPVPEPTTLGLLGLGFVTMLLRRRRHQSSHA